jgi:hypothetical protein
VGQSKSNTNGKGTSLEKESNKDLEAQVSKGLMAVFMKATHAEQALTDLILTADEACSSEDSEEKQLSDLFVFLGLQFDAEKAAEMGGTPCFSGPEGIPPMALYTAPLTC